MIRIFGLKNCDTCRKAAKALPGAELVDIRAEGMPDGLLQQAFDAFGDKVLNTRSTTWRGLSETDRSRAPMELITEHPALMKRPLIQAGDQLYLGWTKDVQAALGV